MATVLRYPQSDRTSHHNRKIELNKLSVFSNRHPGGALPSIPLSSENPNARHTAAIIKSCQKTQKTQKKKFFSPLPLVVTAIEPDPQLWKRVRIGLIF